MMKNFSTDLPCTVCGRLTENGNTFHHLLTQKTYPEFKESSWNLMPLCLQHHNHIHSVPLSAFSAFYPVAKKWLESNGWEYQQHLCKWKHFETTKGVN